MLSENVWEFEDHLKVWVFLHQSDESKYKAIYNW